MLYYILWFVGTIGTLLYKYISYIKYGKKLGVSVKSATFDWFFEPSLSNAVSWMTTLSASWLCSAVYVDKLAFPMLIDVFGPLPLHGAIALFSGIITEMVAPYITKWVITKANSVISLLK
jgi:hypothetical protein